jgi:adenine/guanine phosphoribosyltransferase-like PRPP-binding protein
MFWQGFVPTEAADPDARAWHDRFPALMPDGSSLVLPLRDLGATAVAGLIANQASFAVHDRLVGWMAEAAAPCAAEAVVGLPTLGHSLAAGVARALGHANWVAVGTTRKLWYEERLSAPVSSITSPGGGRRLWLDPRVLDRLAGRRVLLVDDVMSTGRSARAGLSLLHDAGVRPVALCVAMLQGDWWCEAWNPAIPVVAAFATPVFDRRPDGFRVRRGSRIDGCCLPAARAG